MLTDTSGAILVLHRQMTKANSPHGTTSGSKIKSFFITEAAGGVRGVIQSSAKFSKNERATMLMQLPRWVFKD